MAGEACDVTCAANATDSMGAACTLPTPPVTCEYFTFADNGISGWKCSDGATCTNGKDSTGMNCDTTCGTSGEDAMGMACTSGGGGGGGGGGGTTATCTFDVDATTGAVTGWSCDDMTSCAVDGQGGTVDQDGTAGCDATCDPNSVDA